MSGMCIYCGSSNYRKIYENHTGIIPKDESGRSYHIHHIDGNRNNNSPENLIAVSIAEHYRIHYEQGDWGACHILSAMLELTLEQMSDLSKQAQHNRIKKGTHHRQAHNRKDCDLTIYKWENINTGEIIEASCQQMSAKFVDKRTQFTPIIKNKKTVVRGWRLYSEIPYKRKKIVGENNPRYNKTVYKWENIITGEIYELTGWQLSMQILGYYDHGFARVARGELIQYKNLRIYTQDQYKKSIKHRKYNHTKYTWQNIHTNEIICATMNDMQHITNISSSAFSTLVRGRGKTRKGWQLLK